MSQPESQTESDEQYDSYWAYARDSLVGAIINQFAPLIVLAAIAALLLVVSFPVYVIAMIGWYLGGLMGLILGSVLGILLIVFMDNYDMYRAEYTDRGRTFYGRLMAWMYKKLETIYEMSHE